MVMRIRFWGVRGSIATPGLATAGVGGNTSTVEVLCDDERFVFDAGTGIRRLGDALVKQGPVHMSLLLSHMHWDHIQGLPFFVPLYMKSTALTVVGAAHPERSLAEMLSLQMRAPGFPVAWDEVGAEVSLAPIRPGDDMGLGSAHIRTAKVNHPGGCTAYRIDWNGRSVVYATDTEHYACVDPVLVRLAEGADVLIYDSQYTPAEYRGDVGMSKVGWGHSTWEAGCALAEAAGVGQYILYHHDPARSDAEVEAIEAIARTRFPGAVAAREGMEVVLEPTAREHAA